ncbi:MAG: hypothetical protein ACRC2K_08625 [Clostridium sp.]
MNINNKNTENIFQVKGDVTLVTIYKKNGTPLKAQIDTEDLEKVKAVGNWFAEWNKDYNSYLVQNISSVKVNKKAKPLKQGIQAIIMDVSQTTPIKHINGDTLDNRKANLRVYDRNEKNEIEEVDDSTTAILLRDKHGNVNAKALISVEDKELVLQDKFVWTTYKKKEANYVVANTPEGRIYLDKLIMEPTDTQKIHHINLNPLDNRRSNLELTNIDSE